MTNRAGLLHNLLIPLLFVALWSTGFIGSKLGLPDAEPFTFLLIRMVAVAVLLGLVFIFLDVRWPNQRTMYLHIAVVGILIHGVYLGGVFSAIYRGVDAGLAAVIVGLQPLVTVMLSAIYLGEPVGRQKIIGMLVGLAGIAIVIGDRGIGITGVDAIGLGFCIASLIAIASGTIYQKRWCTSVDLLPGLFIQYIATCGFFLVLALAFETREVNWSPTFIFALTWLVLVLSIGAVLLLMWLIRHGEAGKVASLFYLVPPFVAVEAWLLFDEQLSLIAMGGIALCVVGVAVVLNTPAATAAGRP